MRLSTYVMLLFSLGLVFYLMGYSSPLIELLNSQGGHSNPDGSYTPTYLSSGTFVNTLIATLTVSSMALLLVAYLAGFSAIYIIPLVLLFGFLNMVVFPISFIFDMNMPLLLSIPLVAFFNLLTILAIVHFVRGDV